MAANSVIKRIRAMQFWRRDRRLSYREVFGASDATPTRSQAAVLQDLRRFCFAERRTAVTTRTGMVDTHAMALAEGRREVWLRIAQFLELSDEKLARIELMELHDRATVETRANEENYAA